MGWLGSACWGKQSRGAGGGREGNGSGGGFLVGSARLLGSSAEAALYQHQPACLRWAKMPLPLALDSQNSLHAVDLTAALLPPHHHRQARVEAAGGQILFWNGVRVMGLLAVSRAIGDHSLRPYVIAEPEVREVQQVLKGGELGSRGWWEGGWREAMVEQPSSLQSQRCVHASLEGDWAGARKFARGREVEQPYGIAEREACGPLGWGSVTGWCGRGFYCRRIRP